MKNLFNFKWLFNNRFLNTPLKNMLNSLSYVAVVTFFFSVLFALAFIYELIKIHFEIPGNFRLVTGNADILSLWGKSPGQFYFISGIELLMIITICAFFYFFWQFTKNIDQTKPFQNPKAAGFLGAVATLAIVFFLLDTAERVVINFAGIKGAAGTVGYFHFQYLFLAYFINVFAIVYRNGLELKEEMDLVV